MQRTITQNNRLDSETKVGRTIRYSYDANGDLIRLTNGLNQTTSLTIDY